MLQGRVFELAFLGLRRITKMAEELNITLNGLIYVLNIILLLAIQLYLTLALIPRRWRFFLRWQLNDRVTPRHLLPHDERFPVQDVPDQSPHRLFHALPGQGRGARPRRRAHLLHQLLHGQVLLPSRHLVSDPQVRLVGEDDTGQGAVGLEVKLPLPSKQALDTRWVLLVAH